MIDITCSVSEAEYLEAQKIYIRERGRSMLWRRRLVWVVLIAIFVLFATMRLHGPHQQGLSRLIGSFVLIAAIRLFQPLTMNWSLRKRYRLERQNLTDMHYRIDAQGLFCEIAGLGAGTAAWASMNAWFEGTLVFVLRSGLLMRIVPKAALGPGGIDDLRSLLTREIGLPPFRSSAGR